MKSNIFDLRLGVVPLLCLAVGCQATSPTSPRSTASAAGRVVAQAQGPGGVAASDAVATEEKGTFVEFVAPDKSERWSVRSADGSVLCTLPCKGRVGDDSDYFLQREADGGRSVKIVSLPAKFDATQASAVRVVPHAGRGNPVAAVATGVVSLALLVPGMVFLGAGDTRRCRFGPSSAPNLSQAGQTGLGSSGDGITLDGPCDPEKAPHGYRPSDGREAGWSEGTNRAVGVAFIGVGLLGAGLSVAWWSWSHSGRLDVTPLVGGGAARPTLRLGPGVVQGTF